MGMKVLVTGAGGQLGQALKRLTGHEIAALTRARLDITKLKDAREALSSYRPDILINTAAYTDVDGAETDQVAAFKINSLGPRNLALATAEKKIPILQVSTDYVFDGLSRRPYHEFDRTNPLSIYGISKLAGEEAVSILNQRHYIVRTSWLYHFEGKNFPTAMLSLSSRDEISVVSDQSGSPTYAPHLADAISDLIKTEAFGTYHLAGSGGASRYEMTCKLYRLFGFKTRIRPAPTSEFPRPAKRPVSSVLTTLQEPQILLPAWEEGMAEFVERMR